MLTANKMCNIRALALYCWWNMFWFTRAISRFTASRMICEISEWHIWVNAIVYPYWFYTNKCLGSIIVFNVLFWILFGHPNNYAVSQYTLNRYKTCRQHTLQPDVYTTWFPTTPHLFCILLNLLHKNATPIIDWIIIAKMQINIPQQQIQLRIITRHCRRHIHHQSIDRSWCDANKCDDWVYNILVY